MDIVGYNYHNMPTASVLRNNSTILSNLLSGSLQLSFPDGSISLFSAIEFHFHAPSEHTYLGQKYDLELHLIYKYEDYDTKGAAIAIFFDRKHGANMDNRFIDSLRFGETVLN